MDERRVDHTRNLSRVYSEATWNVYDRLDRSLDPAGPDSLHQRAAELMHAGSTILDAGCRDGAHLIRLVQARQATGVGVDPVAGHVERAREAVAAAGLADRVCIEHATLEGLHRPDGVFDLIWCRDVIEQVDSLGPFLCQAARLLKSGGWMLVYTTVVTDLLEPGEAAMLERHLGNVSPHLVESNIESAFEVAGLVIEDKEIIGTQWREYVEERTRPVSTALLRLARLRRSRESIIADHGADIYHHVEANLHWEVFQFLGKLRSIVYLLRSR